MRIPQITAAGKRVHSKFESARDDAESLALAGVDPDHRAVLMDVLAHIARR